MRDEDIDDLVLDEIVSRWPQVLRLFIDWHLHCIVCPISHFHTLADSAAAHGYRVDELREAVLHAIHDEPALPSPALLAPQTAHLHS
jgi:hybrid cluster-associated redox disulfide protein